MTSKPCRRMCYASVAYGEILLLTDCPKADTVTAEHYTDLTSQQIRHMVAAFRSRYIPYGTPSVKYPDYLDVNYLTPEEWRVMMQDKKFTNLKRHEE